MSELHRLKVAVASRSDACRQPAKQQRRAPDSFIYGSINFRSRSSALVSSRLVHCSRPKVNPAAKGREREREREDIGARCRWVITCHPSASGSFCASALGAVLAISAPIIIWLRRRPLRLRASVGAGALGARSQSASASGFNQWTDSSR